MVHQQATDSCKKSPLPTGKFPDSNPVCLWDIIADLKSSVLVGISALEGLTVIFTHCVNPIYLSTNIVVIYRLVGLAWSSSVYNLDIYIYIVFLSTDG